MTKIISAINIKGGVGKTTTICTFAEILANLGNKILVIDADPQANSSQMFQRYITSDYSIINLLEARESNPQYKDIIKHSIQETSYKNIHIISSCEELSLLCDSLQIDTTRISQTILKKALSVIKNDYDYILIDNSPYFNLITINSLTASDCVITPVEADGFSHSGLAMLLSRMIEVKSELNPSLKFLGVFLNKANARTTLFKDLYSNYKERLKESFIETYIRNDNKVKESSTTFIPLITYSKKCNAAKDYIKLLLNLHILDETQQLQLLEHLEKLEN